MTIPLDEVCVIVVAASPAQNELLWPSLLPLWPWESGPTLVVVHRDMADVPYDQIVRRIPNAHFLSKIINGAEVPHRAFGAYRYGFTTFREKFSHFLFISDDVVIRNSNWFEMFLRPFSFQNVGFAASQIFNGDTRYPHETHIRAPMWAATRDALDSIRWNFDSDHHGEMSTGALLDEAGWVGVQVGNKFNVAYDSLEEDHIVQILEKSLLPGTDLRALVQSDPIPNKVVELGFRARFAEVQSPHAHIGRQRVFKDLEPYDGLIFRGHFWKKNSKALSDDMVKILGSPVLSLERHAGKVFE